MPLHVAENIRTSGAVYGSTIVSGNPLMAQNLTPSGVVFATTSGILQTDADFLYSPSSNTIYVPNIAITGMTPGSVLFIGSSGQVAQSNTHLYYDYNNNRLGVGINGTPAGKLHVDTDGSEQVTALYVSHDDTVYNTRAFHVLSRSSGIDMTLENYAADQSGVKVAYIYGSPTGFLFTPNGLFNADFQTFTSVSGLNTVAKHRVGAINYGSSNYGGFVDFQSTTTNNTTLASHFVMSGGNNYSLGLNIRPLAASNTGLNIVGATAQSADLLRITDNSLNEWFSVGVSDLIINEVGADRDFRIEGDTDASLFRLDAGSDTIGIGGIPVSFSKLITYCYEPIISGDDTQFYNCSYLYVAGTNISGGVTDSGYRRGMYIQAYPNTTSFIGTLANMTAIHIDNGTFGTNASGTISTNYGLRIVSYNQGTANVTNLWGLYVQDVDGTSKNYIQRDLRVGTTSNAGNFLANFAGHIGPQTDITYDLGASNLRWRGIYAQSGIFSTSLTLGGSGVLLGNIGDTQVAWASGINRLVGANTFVWDQTNSKLKIGTIAISSGTLQVQPTGTTLAFITNPVARFQRGSAGGNYIDIVADANFNYIIADDLNANHKNLVNLVVCSGTDLNRSYNVYFVDAAGKATGIGGYTERFSIRGTGNAGFNLAGNVPAAALEVRTASTAHYTMYLKGIAAQAQDFLRIDNSSSNELFSVGSSETVVNDGSIDYDFRVESNNQTHMLFVDGDRDVLGIRTSNPNPDRGIVVDVQGGAISSRFLNRFFNLTYTFGMWRDGATFQSVPYGRLINRNSDFLMSPTGYYGTTFPTGYSLYNNSGARPELTASVINYSGAPNSTNKVLMLNYSGGAGGTSPGFGGFNVLTTLGTSGSAINNFGRYIPGNRFLQTFWAKIPEGKTVNLASNALGVSGTSLAMSSLSGTGRWERYSALRVVDESGTLSSTGFIYLTGGADASFVWYVASCELIAIDEGMPAHNQGLINVGYKENVVMDWGNMLSIGNTYLAVDTGNVTVGTSGNPGTFRINSRGNVGPNDDNVWSLGSLSYRWAAIHAETGSIPNLTNVSGINGIDISAYLTGSGFSVSGIAGSISSAQIAFGSASNTVTGENAFTWDTTNKKLTVASNTAHNAVVTISGNNAEKLALVCANNNATGIYLRFLETTGGSYSGGYIHWDSVANRMELGTHTAATTGYSDDVSSLNILMSNGYVGIRHPSPVCPLHVWENTSNVDSFAGVTIEQSGVGDAILQFLIPATQRWVVGIDNSDSDKFKIGRSADLSNTPLITLTTDDKIGLIDASEPSGYLHLVPTGSAVDIVRIDNQSGSRLLTITSTETVFNDDALSRDLRVESISDSNLLYVNGSANTISVGTSSNTGSFKLNVLGHVGPQSGNTFDIGSSGLPWRWGYFNNIQLDNVNGVLKAIDGVVDGGATTSHIPEGSNQYFTVSRAVSAVTGSGVFTPGSIIFANSSSGLSQDAGQFHYDSTNRLMGIRTNAPQAHLHIAHTSARLRLDTTTTAVTSVSGAVLGNGASLQLVAGAANALNCYMPPIVWGSTDPQLTSLSPKWGAAIAARATETYGGDSAGGMALDFFITQNSFGSGISVRQAVTIDQNGRVGIGTGTPAAVLHIKPSGSTFEDGEFIRLDGERSWSFIQRGTGPTSYLHLTDNTGSKQFSVDTTNFFLKRNDATGSGIITFAHGGTNGRTAIGNTQLRTGTTPGATVEIYGESGVKALSINAIRNDCDVSYNSSGTTNFWYMDASTDAVGFGAGGVSSVYAYLFQRTAFAPTGIADFRDSAGNSKFALNGNAASVNVSLLDTDFFVYGSGSVTRFLIYGDAGLHAVGIGTAASATYQLLIQPPTIGTSPSDYVGVRDSSTNELFSVGASDVVVNEAGLDRDFRVEGDTVTNLFFVDASNDSIGIASSASQPYTLTVVPKSPVVTVNSANPHIAYRASLQASVNISSGVTDSSYRRGIYIDAYPNSSATVGTLDNMTAIHIDHGSFGTLASGTTSVNYGLRIVSYSQGTHTTANLWGIYIQDIDGVSKNYIQRDLRVGTTSNAGNFLANFAGHVGPQTDVTYDLGASNLRWRGIYGSSGIFGNNITVGGSGILVGSIRDTFVPFGSGGALTGNPNLCFNYVTNRMGIGSGANSPTGPSGYLHIWPSGSTSPSASTGAPICTFGSTRHIHFYSDTSANYIFSDADVNAHEHMYNVIVTSGTNLNKNFYWASVANANKRTAVSLYNELFTIRGSGIAGFNMANNQPAGALEIRTSGTSHYTLYLKGIDGQVNDYLRIDDTADAFATELFSVGPSDVVINEGGGDREFRVESSDLASMLRVNATGNCVSVNNSGPTTSGNIFNTVANFPAVVSNSTNFMRNIDLYATTVNIASGVTDAGYRVCQWNNSYISNSGFRGTLTAQYGMVVQGGTFDGSQTPSGTITNVYGFYVSLSKGTACTHTNEWGIFQTGRGNNYFANDSRFGTTANAGSFTINSAGHVGPALNVTYDLGAPAHRWRNIYGNSGIFDNISVSGSGLTMVVSYPGDVLNKQIVFASGDNQFAGNSLLKWDHTVQRMGLGVGSATPSGLLHVIGTANTSPWVSPLVRFQRTTSSNYMDFACDASANWISTNEAGTNQKSLVFDVGCSGFDMNLATTFQFSVSGGTTTREVARVRGSGMLCINTTNGTGTITAVNHSSNIGIPTLWLKAITNQNSPLIETLNTSSQSLFSVSSSGVTVNGGHTALNFRVASDNNPTLFNTNGTSDYVTIGGTGNPGGFILVTSGNVGPESSGTRDIGSTTTYWNNLYVNNIWCRNVNGGSVSGGGGTAGFPVTSGQVAFGSGSSLVGDANLYWDNFNRRLGINYGTAPLHTVSMRTANSTTFGLVIAGSVSQVLDLFNVVDASSNEYIGIGVVDTVFNEHAQDRDFRIETTGNPYAFFVDAGSGFVSMGGALNPGAFSLAMNGHLGPEASGTRDLGSIAYPFRGIYHGTGTGSFYGGLAEIYANPATGNISFAGSGCLAFKIGSGTTVIERYYMSASGFSPWLDNNYDLGTNNRNWRNLYVNHIDSITGINGIAIANYLNSGGVSGAGLSGVISSGCVLVGTNVGTISGNTNFTWDFTNRRLGINVGSQPLHTVAIQPASTSTVGLHIVGQASQTADLMTVVNNSSVEMFSIGSGDVVVNGGGLFMDFRAGSAGDSSLFRTSSNTDTVAVGTTPTSSFKFMVHGDIGPATSGGRSLGSRSLAYGTLNLSHTGIITFNNEMLRYDNSQFVFSTGVGVSGHIRVNDNVSGTPSISFLGDTNTGFWRMGADDVGFTAGGVGRFRFDTTKISPLQTITYDLGATNAYWRKIYVDDVICNTINGSAGGGGGIAGSIATSQVAYGASANTIAGSNNFWWDNSNVRLGIGTNSPDSTLHMDAGGSFNTHLTMTWRTSTEAGIKFDDASANVLGYIVMNAAKNLSIQNDVSAGDILFNINARTDASDPGQSYRQAVRIDASGYTGTAGITGVSAAVVLPSTGVYPTTTGASCDLVIEDPNRGIIMQDKTLGTWHRIFLNNGVLEIGPALG
jgi:maltose-binding protein MalE